MGWVNEALLALKAGRSASVRPRGGSMRGRIEDGQPVTIVPRNGRALCVDDVVFVRMKGNFLLHKIIAIEGDRFLIGNNVGGINGWVDASDVLGVVFESKIRERKKMDPLIDIGVNLTHRSFDRDREQVIERARAAGVSVLVLTGTTVAGSRSAAWLAKKSPGTLYATAGIHPHHAKEANDKSFDDLRALFKENEKELVAVGECGLDFNRSFSPHDVQERVFERHLELAIELGRPVFMHERDAGVRFSAIIAKHRDRLPRAVVHCFTGSAEDLARYRELDLFIGITGWICDERRGLHLRDLVKTIPLDRLMLETDAPFLYPRNLPPRDDRRNEPSFLPAVLEVVAAAYGKSKTEIAEATTATARAFFAV